MNYSVVFLYKDRIYHKDAATGEEISIGSHKKDTVFAGNLKPEQIVIKVKNNGIFVKVKEPFHFTGSAAPTDELLSIGDGACLYFGKSSGISETTIRLPYSCIIKFGRADQNDVVIKNRFVTGNSHFVLKKTGSQIRIEDKGSTNGTYLNGKKITAASMRSGDELSILSVKIKLINGVLQFENVGDLLTVRNIESKTEEESFSSDAPSHLRFRRSPRTQKQLPSEEIVLANAPSKASKGARGRGMLSGLIGSGAMMGASLLTGMASPALLAARAAYMVSPLTGVAFNKKDNKTRTKEAEKYELLRREKYSAYIDAQKANILSVASEQREILTEENPEPAEWIDTVFALKRKLWERMPSDRDFLDVRLGMGYEDLCVPVKARLDTNTLQLENDEIKELTEQIIEETRIVDNVPLRLSLKTGNTVGILGDRPSAVGLVRNMLVSLTASHCRDDVRIVGIFDERERKEWSSLRWLPHVWDDEQRFRTLAFSKEEAHAVCDFLSDLIKQRRTEIREGGSRSDEIARPFYIIVLGAKELVENEPLMNELFDRDPRIGVTSVFMFDNLFSLPQDCRQIVELDKDPYTYQRNEINKRKYFSPDPVTDTDTFDAFARRMSAIELEGFSKTAGLPSQITFLQGLGVKRAEELDVMRSWHASKPFKSLAAPIGVMEGGKVFSLDIHEKAHGPNGLVAGTVGSGKSELLQTWILSMALKYHPHEVAFVLIDYKGGGMANLLEPLPHVIGKITNIDAGIQRFLNSLKGEKERRQRIFVRAGVNHIDAYQERCREGLAKEPVPHLIIVSDEFAELKKYEPEFMKEIVSLARVGRSLGLHLVLATQKPGGIVDDQIQANSRFRICLKVVSVGDSREMIKRPDAAKLVQCGRAYVRVGEDECFDLFQSLWSGAPYHEPDETDINEENQVRVVDMLGQRRQTVRPGKVAKKAKKDELAAVVEHICAQSIANGIKPLRGPWLPELPDALSLQELTDGLGFDGRAWQNTPEWLKIPIGMYDVPIRQEQGIQTVDFAEEGHLGIYGAPGTGKTTLLKTIALSFGLCYSPKDVNLYILDFNGWGMSVCAHMPHVGGIALDTEEEKVSKLTKLILSEMESRKKLFLKHTVSSLSSYRDCVSDDLPAIILLIDNLVSVFELYPDLESFFITVAMNGAAYGIYMVYTANSTTGVRYKVLNNIRNAIAFEMTDKGDYTMIVGRPEGISLPKKAGRALYKGMPPTEFQAALPAPGASEKEKMLALQGLLKAMNSGWTGNRPKPIPVMPDEVNAEDLAGSYTNKYRIPVGLYCEDILPAYADLADDYTMLISGGIGSGKSRMLLQMAKLVRIRFPSAKLFAFDGQKESLKELSGQAYQYAPVSDNAAVTAALNELVEMLNARKKAQNAARHEQGDTFDEASFLSDYEMLFIAIDDLREFVDAVSDANKNTMERICRMAQHLGVTVVCCGRIADMAKYNEIESLTRAIIGNQNGLAMNGTPAQYSFFRNNLKYSEREIEAGEGNAYLYFNGSCKKVKVI